MRRYVRYEPFDIYCFESSEWSHPVHKHTYFEIIFVRTGSGKHILNGNEWPYCAGDIFLLGPEDYHSFEIHTSTQFCYLRFTETFVQDTASTKHRNWQQTINTLFTSAYGSNGPLVQGEGDKKTLNHLLEVLLYEYENRHKGSFDMMMDSLMKAVLSILARNVISETSSSVQTHQKGELIEQLLMYLRQHIHDPEKLRMKRLAERFHYSPAYMSTFFKKQVGESLQQFIMRYKLKLIEHRLQNSEATIADICGEFGFTDESHLSKVFRKHTGSTPGVFRKKSGRVPPE